MTGSERDNSSAATKCHFPPGGVLVIGGTGAIGRAVVEGFLTAGCDAAFTFRHDSAQIDEVSAIARAKSCRVAPIRYDLNERGGGDDLLLAARKELGQIHSVIYAAGPDFQPEYVSQTKATGFANTLKTEVDGFFELSKAAIPHLRAQGGSITAVTTTATARYVAKDVLSTAPKAAIEAVIKAIAFEEGRYGIRANAVAPGWIDAGIGARIVRQEHYGRHETLAGRIPLRRFGTVAEVASAILFLSSQTAAYVTGQVLAVDGGWRI